MINQRDAEGWGFIIDTLGEACRYATVNLRRLKENLRRLTAKLTDSPTTTPDPRTPKPHRGPPRRR
ncbi:hypothetical protein AB0O07_07050 [Streptomyces sp. NPDC093085]|uniref:hypothetical protein n=1 Tax=Streptomyces sp. NPDC093085 TaxID=3155068 RepID=UPI00344A360D